MNKGSKRILDFSANLSKKLAIKSCGAASLFDSYQPRRPDAVSKLAISAKTK